MKWELNLPEFWKAVYYLARIIGLAPFTVKGNRFHPPSLFGIFYPVLLATGYSLTLTRIFLLTIGNLNIGNSPLLAEVLTTLLYLTSLATSLTPIIFLLMYKKIVYIMNKLCVINSEFRNLNIVVDHVQLFKNLFTTIVTANSVLVALYVIIILVDPTWGIIISIKYTIDSWFSFNMTLIFAKLLIHIKQRFALLNERLHDVLVPFGREVLPRRTRIFVVSRKNPEENQPGSEGLTDLQQIRKIESLHLELRDVVERTTDVFAIPILCHSIRHFFALMLSPYWIYLILQSLNHFNIAAVFCFSLRTAITIVTLFIIAHASAITCEQGNAVRAVLSKGWTKIRTAKLQREYLMFSFQLLHTPVTVSAFGFMDLGYSFVFNMFWAVATYTIVMIQLDN